MLKEGRNRGKGAEARNRTAAENSADKVSRRAAGRWRRRSGGQVQFAHMYPVVACTTQQGSARSCTHALVECLCWIQMSWPSSTCFPTLTHRKERWLRLLPFFLPSSGFQLPHVLSATVSARRVPIHLNAAHRPSPVHPPCFRVHLGCSLLIYLIGLPPPHLPVVLRDCVLDTRLVRPRAPRGRSNHGTHHCTLTLRPVARTDSNSLTTPRWRIACLSSLSHSALTQLFLLALSYRPSPWRATSSPRPLQASRHTMLGHTKRMRK